MSKHRLPIFDGDGHIYENEAEIARYFEGEFAGARRFETFSLFPSLDGWSRGLVMEKIAENRKYTHTDAAVWSEMLTLLGAEGSVLYPTAGLAFGLMQDAKVASALATAYNNWLEDRYTRQDKRLYGAGMMAVQDPASAAREIERCARDRVNFCAMYVPTRTSTGRSYGDAFFDPIYAAAEGCDIALGLHGGPSLGMGFDHFQPFVKVHTLEHPFPLLIELTDMIFSGVFDRFPRLRVAFLEGGCGWVPFMMDRMDYEFDSVFGAVARRAIKKRPSEYISTGENFWVSLELGERSLKYTIDAMGGSDRIIYASDYPHEPSEEDLSGDVPSFLASPDYDDTVKKNILYNNQLKLYRIKL